MRKALIAAALIVVLVVVAVLIVPGFINWNAYKADIVAIAEDATGRTLAIDGDISLRLLPSPALSVANVRLANPQGAADPNLVSLESLEVQAAFWPLLRRELQVRSVRLRKPQIALEILADGTATWEFTPAPKEDEPAGGDGNGSPGGIAGITLEEFVIEGGQLTFRDAASGLTEQIEAIDATLSAQELTTGPYEARGEMMARGMNLRFRFRVGDLAADGPIPLEGNLALDDAGLSIVFRGAISEAGPDAQLTGRIEAAGDDLRAAIAAIAEAAETEAAILVPGAQPFSLRASIDGNRSDVSVNDIEFALGDTRANGAVSVALGEAPAVDAALSFGRIDLDAWLGTAPLESGGRNEETAAPAAPPGTPGGGLVLPLIPVNLTGNVSLSAEALTFRGDAVRQVELSAAVGDGVLKINRLSALLPGGSDLVAAGQLAVVEGQPQFDGTLESASDDLRGLLAWLGTDIDQVPADRLRKISLQSSLRVTGELVQVFGIDLRLDSTRLTGGAAYALRARPSFSLDFDVDRLNLDAYLTAADDTDDTDDEPLAAAASPDDASAVADGGLSALAILNEFDANIALSIATLTYQDERFDGVGLDGSLIGGVLTLREARIDSAAGASVSIDGTARNFDGPVEFAAKVAIAADDPSRLLRLVQADGALPGNALGALGVSGAVSGTPEELALDLESRLGDTRANVSGTLALAAAQARIDVSVGIRNDSLVDLMGAIGMPLAPVTPELDGPVSIAGTIKGDVESLAIDLQAVAAGAELGVAGGIGDVTTAPVFNLAFNAAHPNLTKFLGALGVDYRPAASNLGAFGLSADVAGGAQAMQMSALEAAIGPVNILGEATLALDGARPRITAALSTSEILVDLFLPRIADETPAGAGVAAGAPAKTSTASRWSSDPLDLSLLRAVDGEIELAARGLSYGSYRFQDPSLTLRLADGVLAINPLRGVLFDGDVSLRMRVEEGPALGIAANIALSGADIERALIESAGLDQVTGRFDLTGDLATLGRSQREMISNLGGNLSFAARDGVVRGVALGALSDRLKELNQALDLLALIQTSLSGGETPYAVFQGTFDIADGIARSTDLSAVMEAAQGAGTAVVDLPTWQMDLRTQARLTEHPGAPAVGLDLFGPIDAPQREIKSADIEAYLATRVGTTLLRRLLPGDDEAQTEEGAGDEGAGESLRPRDIPRDILRGIIRGIGN